MEIGEIIEIIEKAKGGVSSRCAGKIREVIALCESYRYLGNRFTFDADADLEGQINLLFLQLSNEILADIESYANAVIQEEDRNTVIPWLYREQSGQTLVYTVDRHSSHLKSLAEGYIAIGFAGKKNVAEIFTSLWTSLSNPYGSPIFREAVAQGDYLSEIIASGGLHYGRGVLLNPVEALTLTEQTKILEAAHKSNVNEYERENYVGYICRRGSGYLCPTCDDVCYGGKGKPIVYSFSDEMPLPVHPRCMCYTMPVTKEEIDTL